MTNLIVCITLFSGITWGILCRTMSLRWSEVSWPRRITLLVSFTIWLAGLVYLFLQL